jgi:hypothetical protein
MLATMRFTSSCAACTVAVHRVDFINQAFDLCDGIGIQGFETV